MSGNKDSEITVRYFAWVRERVGTQSESVHLPGDVGSVGALLPHLLQRSKGHALALGDMKAVRVAVNRKYGGPETAIKAGDEIAFFPPVTGG